MENNSIVENDSSGWDTLILMRKYELILKDLYTLFSQENPVEKYFWKKLAQEEEKHAYWFEVLAMNVDNKNICFNKSGAFNIPLMQESFNHIKEAMADFKTSPPSLFDALSFASDIENSLIERKFFEIFDGQSDELDKVMKLLEEETTEHSKRIDEKLEKEREFGLNSEKKGVWNKIKNKFNH